MLSQLLYNQPELRPAVLKSLNLLVQSNVVLAADRTGDLAPSNGDVISVEEARRNVDFLRSQAESWFAVLFNVFGSVGRDGQGIVGDVISTWASITDEKVRALSVPFLSLVSDQFTPQEMTKACRKVVGLFKANLAKASTPVQSHNDQKSVVTTMQDILVLLIPYLPTAEAKSIFDLCLTPEVLTNKDNGVQKRGYKLLGKLVESGNVEIDAETMFKTLEEVADNTAAAAKKVCLVVLRLRLSVDLVV